MVIWRLWTPCILQLRVPSGLQKYDRKPGIPCSVDNAHIVLDDLPHAIHFSSNEIAESSRRTVAVLHIDDDKRCARHWEVEWLGSGRNMQSFAKRILGVLLEFLVHLPAPVMNVLILPIPPDSATSSAFACL